jgi:hypothetical protein
MLLGSGPLWPRKSAPSGLVVCVGAIAAGRGTGGAVCVSAGAVVCVGGVSDSGCATAGGAAIIAAAAIANGERKDFMR